ncbi:MAG: trigger factor [Bacteroidales bacterium]|nr:trigger factor [Bacteroidales bacterium]
MNVIQEKTGDLTALIKIELEQQDYQPQVDKQLKEQRKKVNMPGFRVGQVPLSMVRKMYETPVKAQEIERVMSENLYKYISDNKLQILGSPLANNEKTPEINWEKDTSFTFCFDIALQPEFTLDLSKEKTTDYEIEPTEEILTKFIEDIRLRYGKLENPETVGEKDMLYGHLEELKEDGTKKEDGVDTNATIFVDRIALKTIKDKFIGKKKGATVTFKPHKAFKDQTQLATVLHKKAEECSEFTSDCTYTIDTIQRMNMAEMNEEFFKRAYANKEIKTEEEFKNTAKEDLCKTYSSQSNNFFINKVSEQLVKDTKIELPVEFLKRWIVETSEGKTTAEDIEKDTDKYMDGVKWQLIEGKITTENNISVTDEEIISYYKNELLPNYFPPMPNTSEEEKKDMDDRMTKIATDMLREREQTAQVHNFLLERKVTELLKEKTSVKIKKVDMDEFMKEVQKSTSDKK